MFRNIVENQKNEKLYDNIDNKNENHMIII